MQVTTKNNDAALYLAVPISPKSYICLQKGDPGFLNVDTYHNTISTKSCMVVIFDEHLMQHRHLMDLSDVDGYLQCLDDHGYTDISERFQEIHLN